MLRRSLKGRIAEAILPWHAYVPIRTYAAHEKNTVIIQLLIRPEMEVYYIQIKVTTSIDPYLKASFEATKSIHNKSFSEVLEEGVKQILEELTPLESVKLTISQKEQELSELRARLAELEVLAKQRKDCKKEDPETNSGVDKYLEDFRRTKFSEHIESALKMLRKGNQPNWKHMAPLYQFSDVNEFKKWYFKTMEEEGITI